MTATTYASKWAGAVNFTLADGTTVIRIPAASGSIPSQTYNSSVSHVVGVVSPKVTTGGYNFDANLRIAEGTGNATAYDELVDALLAGTSHVVTFYNASNAVDEEVLIANAMKIQSISNWIQADANSGDAKFVDVVLKGGGALEAGITVGDATLPTYTPVAMQDAIIKVTISASMTALTDVIRVSNARLERAVSPYHVIATDAPAGIVAGGYVASVDVTVLHKFGASNSTSLSALVGGASTACEFYTPNAASTAHKFVGNWKIVSQSPPMDFDAESSDPKEITYTFQLDGALTHTVVS